MEILVILMLSAAFFAIAMFIASFIMIRKHQTDKAYEKALDNLYFEDDDFDNDDETNEEFFDNEENELNNLDIIKTETLDEDNKIINEEIDVKEEVLVDQEFTDNNKFDDTTIDIIIPKIEKNNEENIKEKNKVNLQEVVNVLINKKNYICLSNNNVINKGEHIKLLLNKKIYYGLITKSNYDRDINALKNKPQKLVIIKNNKIKKEDIEILELDEIEFIPKRKNQN